ncbi:hypothetical protein D3C74_104700 [compost metagenome]
MEKMYPPVVNSPKTELSELITDTQTEITVANASVLLQGEGIVVLGNGDVAETITYTSIEENVLKGCVRGFEGAARAWPVGTRVARNFTAADFKAVQANIEELEGKVDAVSATATAALPASQKGAANGVATLGSDSKVPATQLPISTSTGSTSPTSIASSSAVKSAYDLANSGLHPYPLPASGTDLNNLVATGLYRLTDASNYINMPNTSSSYGILTVQAEPAGYITQTLITVLGIQFFFRARTESGTWTAWKQVFTTSGGNVNAITINGNAPALKLVGIDHIYQEFHPRGEAVGRKGYLGFSDGSSNIFAITNEYADGDILLYAKGYQISMDALRVSTAIMYMGSGSPEGSIAAPLGALYRNRNGGAGTTLYIKESGGGGNVGWRAI